MNAIERIKQNREFIKLNKEASYTIGMEFIESFINKYEQYIFDEIIDFLVNKFSDNEHVEIRIRPNLIFETKHYECNFVKADISEMKVVSSILDSLDKATDISNKDGMLFAIEKWINNSLKNKLESEGFNCEKVCLSIYITI